MEERIEWVDTAKGIGIILVVYAHLLSSGFNARLPIASAFFHFSDSLVYSFHMPLFFFLAGLFARQSCQKRGPRSFVTDKLFLLLYPYLIWSVVQTSVELLLSHHSQRGISVGDILAVPYLPWSQFWFLYALAWMYVGYALLSGLGRFAATAMTAAGTVLFFWPLRTEVMGLNGFSTGFLFFVFGVLLEQYGRGLDKMTVPVGLIPVLLLLLLGSCWYIFGHLLEPVRLTNGSHPFYFLYLAAVGIGTCIGVAQQLSRIRLFRPVKTAGVYSLQIYLVHMLAGVGARIVLLKLFHVRDPFVHMIIGVGAGLIIPVVLYKAALQMKMGWLFALKDGPMEKGLP